MLSNFRSLLKLRVAARRMYSSDIKEVPRNKDNLNQAIQHYQRDDGVPVYLKGGLKDRLLVGLTVLILAVGLTDSVVTILSLDRKK